MIISDNLRQALSSVRSARWRSLFTMTGVIIGVASVITIVSIGEGVKRQIVNQISSLGPDVVVILPGAKHQAKPFSLGNDIEGFSAGAISNLNERDFEAVRKTSIVKTALPITVFSSGLTSDQAEIKDGLIVGTSAAAPEILNQNIEYGSFFRDLGEDKQTVVIGRNLADRLYKELSPIGETLKIRDQKFVVRGVLEKFEGNPLDIGADLNSVVLMHYTAVKTFTDGSLPINQILVKPNEGITPEAAAKTLTNVLSQAHGNQEDFTILKQADALNMVSGEINLLTALIGGIAAISLLVGGIGIMNIMLLAVTERTHEIGIRKAIGASNRQILGQFLSEALVLSVWGGVLGLALAGLINFLLRVFSNFQPVITLPVVGLALGVSVLMGIIFGIAPALKAARKNPIDALRSGD